MSQSRAISGLFTPYLRECDKNIDKMEAQVEGQIPTWIDGCFMANGPGGSRFNSNQYQHLFDGPAMLRKFTIKLGKVFFECKYLNCQTWRTNRKHNRIIVPEFGTKGYPDPCKSLFNRFSNYFFMNNLFNDNSQVGFWSLNNAAYAVGESPILSKINLANLSTLQTIDLRKLIPISTAIAHVHYDNQGNLYAMGNSIRHYNLLKITASNDQQLPFDVSIIAKVPVRRLFQPSYYHSFCITQKFWVFIEQPLILSVKSLTKQNYLNGTNSRIMKWKPEYKTQIHLISRHTGSHWPIKYVTDAFAFFHTINAYEDDGHVVVDICCYKNADILKLLTMKAIKSAASNPVKASNQANLVQSEAKRFVLPLCPFKNYRPHQLSTNLNTLNYTGSSAFLTPKAGHVKLIAESLTTVSPLMAEMPRINYNRNGLKYRYFYALSRRKGDLLLQLIKCDTLSKTHQLWFANDHYPSEPIFIPKPEAIDEDDGVVISYIISEVDEKQGFLLFLDGKSFTEIARATMKTASKVYPHFHGYFFPGHGLIM